MQDLIYEDDAVLVTYLAETPLARPMLIDGTVALEPGAPAVWFTFPDRMHDIGRFHTARGEFTGLYANIMQPVEMHTRLEWSATDLFIDVWVPAGGAPRLLDEDELEVAVKRGWISSETAAAARGEAEWLMEAWRSSRWPPAIVNEWPITRVREGL
ncbi:MAG: DUF402 domain-containing protein [Gemmatimonadota bacterium]